ncbi:MAG: methyltransferase domain-containing protein, partial [Anaerolineales bacterium]
MFARVRAALASPNSSKRLYDYFFASLLFSLPTGTRRRLYAGQAHYCPICESHLRTFLRLHRPYHRYCPVCRSLQRYRLVWLFFNSRYVQIGDQPARMLHIAPEPALARRFQQVPGLSYLSADLYNSSAMVRMDISDIRYPEASFDVIYCSHVLEHVPDDRRALAEFHRVLSPGGYAVLLVPILSSSTLEDPKITSPEERQRIYGQHDHLRSYGPDFKERVEQAGFKVRTVVARDLVAPADAYRMGLGDD